MNVPEAALVDGLSAARERDSKSIPLSRGCRTVLVATELQEILFHIGTVESDSGGRPSVSGPIQTAIFGRLHGREVVPTLFGKVVSHFVNRNLYAA